LLNHKINKSTPNEANKILLEQSFSAHMPLLTAISTFGLGRRCSSSPQQCYLHHLCTTCSKHAQKTC